MDINNQPNNNQNEDEDKTQAQGEQEAGQEAAPTAVHEDEKEEGYSMGNEVFEWVQAIVVAVVIALTIRTFLFTFVNVQGASMEPTLHDGNRLVVYRLGYVPQQKDIVIFRPKMHKDTPYIKRVIAVPGQTVDLNRANGKVKVDGVELNEPYVKDIVRSFGSMHFPVKVGKNEIFAMGDNRNNSLDSRFVEVGLIPYDTIIGKAMFRFWPLEEIGSVYK